PIETISSPGAVWPAFAPDGVRLAWATTRGAFLRDRAGSPPRLVSAPRGVCRVHFHPSSEELFVLSDDGVLEGRTPGGEMRWQRREIEPSGKACGLALTPDVGLVAVAHNRGLALRDTEGGWPKRLRLLEGKRGLVSAVTISPDGRWLGL